MKKIKRSRDHLSRRRRRAEGRRSTATIESLAALVATLLVVAIYWGLRPSEGVEIELPGEAAWDPSWPPVMFRSSPRDDELVHAAYAYAARRPDVFRYMPCYCGCERYGHGSLADCFVAGRDADGTPRWDQMGFT